MNFASIDSVFPSPLLILFLHLPFSGREEKAPWISQLCRQSQIPSWGIYYCITRHRLT